MKPRILIDAVSLLSPLTGIGRYTYEISKKLQKYDDLELNFFYGYFSKNLLEPSKGSSVKNLKTVLFKSKFVKRALRRILNIFGGFFSSAYDLYWQPNFIPNEGIKAKKVVTSVHDFSFILHSEFHPKERIEYFNKYFFKNITRSDMIITGSEFSKKEIIQRLDFHADRVRVIYHGVDHNVFKVYNDIELDMKLPKKFILSVGSIEPRKNLAGLLKAYNLLNDKTKAEYKLVLVGFKGWNNSEIMELINKNKENIIYLGFISDEELAKVYNLASVFVFASFYEGFGLPVLESMACATPVTCSNSSSIPEVGGDAVLYFNPKNAEDIKNKIETVLSDEKLREEMVSKGLDRAKEFSWERSAEQHAKVFKEVLDS